MASQSGELPNHATQPPLQSSSTRPLPRLGRPCDPRKAPIAQNLRKCSGNQRCVWCSVGGGTPANRFGCAASSSTAENRGVPILSLGLAIPRIRSNRRPSASVSGTIREPARACLGLVAFRDLTLAPPQHSSASPLAPTYTTRYRAHATCGCSPSPASATSDPQSFYHLAGDADPRQRRLSRTGAVLSNTGVACAWAPTFACGADDARSGDITCWPCPAHSEGVGHGRRRLRSPLRLR